jgi:hypothetical protein
MTADSATLEEVRRLVHSWRDRAQTIIADRDAGLSPSDRKFHVVTLVAKVMYINAHELEETLGSIGRLS